MKRKDVTIKLRKLFDKQVLSALGLICLIIISFVAASVQVNRVATDSCFSTLNDAAVQVANEVCEQMSYDEEQLKVIADLLSQHDDLNSGIVSKHVASFRRRSSLSAVGILFPDNHLMLGDKEVFDNMFDYEQELAKTPYVSGIKSGINNEEEQYIYRTVPIEKDGQTVGILYGFISLDDLTDCISVTAYGGNAGVCVADGETGDFLIDTWHNKRGNVFDEGVMSRKVKPGYDFRQMKQDFLDGTAGNVAFWSNTEGEYLYSCYMPAGVNKWMVQVLVKESIVFARAIWIRKILCRLVVLEIIIFALYFGWIILMARRAVKAKEIQLKQTKYMYDIQETLFGAHKNLSHITEALKKASKILTAKISFLMAMDGNVVKEIFSSYPSSDENWVKSLEGNRLDELFPCLFGRLESGKSLLLYSDELKELQREQDWKALEKINITGLMLVPVFDSSEKLIGILGGANMEKCWKDTELLECVARNFMMALDNINSYRQIEYMGIIDALTGLQNRNCYEKSLHTYLEKYKDLLCCLYIDANGLHELNNTLGHAAGDEMLVCIGSALKTMFGAKDTYRIGGDEFVVFCMDYSEQEVKECLEALQGLMDERGYHIAIGRACHRHCKNLKEMVAAAEANMYEEKSLYYHNRGDESKARMMNQRHEHTLVEKKDADAFLDV